jgi:chromosome segregation ATPase
MWVPKQVVDWFQISKDSVDELRAELAAVRAERDVYEHQLTVTQSSFDWLKMRINQLEVERAELIKKAYGISSPVPEIVRTPPELTMENFSFDDVGNDKARELGLPVYPE